MANAKLKKKKGKAICFNQLEFQNPIIFFDRLFFLEPLAGQRHV